MKADIEIIRTDSPLGTLQLEFRGEALAACSLVAAPPDPPDKTRSSTAKRVLRELAQYFAGTGRDFSVHLAPTGTPFQLAVWAALRSIPYGEIRTYGEVARMIGRPLAVRAVGGACHNNPLLIFTPCHRVVAANGTGGFGSGLENKRKLLTIETGNDRPFGMNW